MLSLKDVFEGRKPIYAIYRKLRWKFSFLIESISEIFLKTSDVFWKSSDVFGNISDV